MEVRVLSKALVTKHFSNGDKNNMATQRAPAVQSFVDKFAAMAGITPAFMAASDHPYSCRCNICLRWWAEMPDDEDEEGNASYGPFTADEVVEARLHLNDYR